MEIKIVVTGDLKENCYVLLKDNECLVIDPGDGYEDIKKEIGTNKVVGILLTHDHFDHIGSVKKIKGDYKCLVYSFDNLKEGYRVINNFDFEVIYTPGHTIGSISFYFKEYKAMFTGDFLFKNSIGRCDLPTGDFNDMTNSLNKIKMYDDDTVIYPGHGDSTTLIHEKFNNEYLFTN